jgi:hypothetical protein
MTDLELTRALERGDIPNECFRHASHLHVAWVYLAESTSLEEAAEKMSATLRRFAAAAGKSEKYHETMTRFWMYLLARFRASESGQDLREIVEANPRLLEKNFPLDYYSRERLFSDRARTEWLKPDLKPIPADGT